MSEKRYSYDNKTVSLLKDGEFWLDGQVDTACNHSEICAELNEQDKRIKELENELELYKHYVEFVPSSSGDSDD